MAEIFGKQQEMDAWLKEYDKRAADMKFNDIKLPQAPGTPAPDGWGGKVTSLEGVSTLNPDYLILMSESESESNVLEGSSIWEGGRGEERSNLPDDNEAFTAWGKLSVMEQLAHEILQKINVSKGLDFF
ncbi:hypothetical protein PDENDC454_14422 [Paenibacillus dendritiformis C454]|uniref:Uncharacterized protein n=1 Tax=Paenibacillus dendritiformis C454 TaxID=1131935 RepID=H3SH77_9BACL|nr:hypothetical protein PDENDC454_14422 [Paenibacillus dendritiformis C454]